jgi:HK97 family phage major capsid protein
VEYAKQTVRDYDALIAAGPTAENTSKPESAFEWEKADAAVRTIAHWVPVSRQAVEDALQLQGLIDSELRYGLDFVEEDQLLNGTGVGQQLNGLLGEATAYSAAFVPDGLQQIDTLRLMMLQVALAEYPADGIVVHPTDWAKIELLKDGESRYLFANATTLTGPRLWGLPVVATQSMAENNALVGAFRMAATIYDRMGAEVLISSEDQDNFIKNMLTVRAEKRLALAVKRPAALVTGELVASSS